MECRLRAGRHYLDISCEKGYERRGVTYRVSVVVRSIKAVNGQMQCKQCLPDVRIVRVWRIEVDARGKCDKGFKIRLLSSTEK